MKPQCSSCSSMGDGRSRLPWWACHCSSSLSRPSSASSTRTQNLIARWQRQPAEKRNPRLRYLDPDDPFDLRDLVQAMEARRRLVPVAVAVCVALALLGWALLSSEEQDMIDTAIGVARRD